MMQINLLPSIHVRTTTPLPNDVEAAVQRLHDSAMAGSECATEFLLAWDDTGEGFRLADLMNASLSERQDIRCVLKFFLCHKRLPPQQWQGKISDSRLPDELVTQEIFLMSDRPCSLIDAHEGWVLAERDHGDELDDDWYSADWCAHWPVDVVSFSTASIAPAVKIALTALFDQIKQQDSDELESILFSWWIPVYFAGFRLTRLLQLSERDLANVITLWEHIAKTQAGPPAVFQRHFEDLLPRVPQELWPAGCGGDHQSTSLGTSRLTTSLPHTLELT